MNINKFFAMAAMALPLTVLAQENTEVLPNIQFETEDYAKLGIYDTWEESPFRVNKFADPAATQPLLQGNVKVTGNFLQELDEQLNRVVNPSEKILAVQRSIFGSNTFGARVDLKQPFELTPTVKYIHVMVNRPYGGRVMVVGLGKRRDNAEQSKETEQFWAMSLGDVPASKWYDVVLPIKGNGGIDIYSLVVVPDCESPHTGTQSQMCYIDNLCVNNNPRPAFVYEYYPVSFDKNAEITRDDRFLSGVGLESKDGLQKVVTKKAKKMAYNKFEEETFKAVAGETVAPKFDYTAKGPMYGYVYVDWDQNGRFEESELMTSAKASGNNAIVVPEFTVPQNTLPGNYYMRYKVDWDNTDPAGSVAPGNELVKNGGGIMDIRLNIHGTTCNVNTKGLNGDLFAINEKGEQVALNNYKVPFGESFRVRIVPENGFTYDGISIKHGYKLSGQEVEKDCRQWAVDAYHYADFDENNELVIPASCLDGADIEIENFFVESKGEPFSINPTPQTGNLKSAFYLVKATSDKGTGYVYCDGQKLVIDHQISFSEKVTENQYKYLWSVNNDGKGNYQLENYMDLYYFGNGNFQTQEFGVTVPATFTLNEVAPKFAEGKWCTMKTIQNDHVTYIHMNGAKDNGKLGYWDSGEVGSEAGSIALFQFSEIQAVPRIRVAYNYVLDGNIIKTVKKIQGPQSNYKAPAMNIANATVGYADNEKVSEENSNITVNSVEHLPFIKTLSKDAPVYQAIDMRGSDKVLYWNVADNGDVMVNQPQGGRNNVELLTSDAYQWCIMGNVIEGFKIYNKKKGFDFALKNSDPAGLVVAEEASSWYFAEGHSSLPGSAAFFVEDGSYLNWQGDRLKYWNEKDVGSSVRFFSPFGLVDATNDHVTLPGLLGGRTYFDDAEKSEAFVAAYKAAAAEPGNATLANAYAVQLKAAMATPFKSDEKMVNGKLYRIKNFCRNLTNGNVNHNFEGAYLSSEVKKEGYSISCHNDLLNDAGAIWQAVTDGEHVKLKNMNAGAFAGSDNTNNNTYIKLVGENDSKVNSYAVKSISNKPGLYKISCGDNDLHVSTNGVMFYKEDGPSDWMIFDAAALEVALDTAADASYRSLYLPFAVTLPVGTEAFAGVLLEATATLGMDSIKGLVPANTGVVLKNKEKLTKISLGISDEKLAPLAKNSLSGTNMPVALNNENKKHFWLLAKDPVNGIGFYSVQGEALPANYAFLESAMAPIKGFALDFDYDDEMTGLGTVPAPNGLHGDIYDLNGRLVKANSPDTEGLQPGIYIMKGKKLIVK